MDSTFNFSPRPFFGTHTQDYLLLVPKTPVTRGLYDRLGDDAERIDVHVYAPGVTRPFDGSIRGGMTARVEKVDYTADGV